MGEDFYLDVVLRPMSDLNMSYDTLIWSWDRSLQSFTLYVSVFDNKGKRVLSINDGQYWITVFS